VNHPEFELIEDLVAANRILAQYGVLDGYGHVSVRSQRDPARYLMSRSVAPESVSADIIIELDLDSNPVEQSETTVDGAVNVAQRLPFIHPGRQRLHQHFEYEYSMPERESRPSASR